jgi:hypothetical protein
MIDWPRAMIDWLNSNSGFVLALLTLVYVICTIVLCIIAWRSNRLAISLHNDIHRPVVVCDFFTEHALTYLRVKNWGSQPASNIRITVEGPAPQLLKDWKDHAVVKNGIALLSPLSEMVTLYRSPGSNDWGTVSFQVRYEGPGGRKFEESYVVNLEAWLHEDLGRENNSPIAKGLREIADKIGQLK